MGRRGFFSPKGEIIEPKTVSYILYFRNVQLLPSNYL